MASLQQQGDRELDREGEHSMFCEDADVELIGSYHSKGRRKNVKRNTGSWNY